jgi:hypothetical protein
MRGAPQGDIDARIEMAGLHAADQFEHAALEIWLIMNV